MNLKPQEPNLINEEYGDRLTCPYCGYEEDEPWDFVPDENGQYDVGCGSCGKIYEASLYISHSYTSKTKELIEKEKKEFDEYMKKERDKTK